jgi:hypothetical protein
MKKPFDARDRFFYASPYGPLRFKKKQLESFLPVARPGGNAEAVSQITYRDYLEAVRQFIEDHWEEFLAVLVARGVKDPMNNVESIDVIAEKHGGDYHPARIKVEAGGVAHSFAVNAALTPRGKERAEQDFNLLALFSERFPARFTPKAYFPGEVNFRTKSQETISGVMFMGEWLDGYHEFHLSKDPKTGALKTILWNSVQGHQLLSPEAGAKIFRQAAMILTYYYDTRTFAEIYPWHHAAGDFVANYSEQAVRVKLITLRQYAPRIVFVVHSPANHLEALIFFLANLTIRMRLDRLNGVGGIAWAGDCVVDETVSGFLAGMRAQIEDGIADDELLGRFVNAAKRMSLPELSRIFQAVIESYDDSAPDLPVILNHLADHIFSVYRALKELTSSR